MEDAKEFLEQVIQEEEFYQFPSFCQDNVWELAQDLVEAGKNFRGPLAVEIDLAGTMVFCYYPTGVGSFNTMWIERKRNTVMMFHKSSLRVGAEMAVEGEDLEKDRYLDPKKYVNCGGGFPIKLKNGCMVGFIGASGLTDREDHASIIAGLERYFRRNFPELYQA